MGGVEDGAFLVLCVSTLLEAMQKLPSLCLSMFLCFLGALCTTLFKIEV